MNYRQPRMQRPGCLGEGSRGEGPRGSSCGVGEDTVRMCWCTHMCVYIQVHVCVCVRARAPGQPTQWAHLTEQRAGGLQAVKAEYLGLGSRALDLPMRNWE